MVAIAVVMLLIAVIIGMGISICAFGTGGKRAKVFEDIYFSVEDVNDMGIIYTKGGDYTAILKIRNPIRKYSASKARDGSLVVLLEHLYVEDVLTHEYLVGNLGYLEFSILVEDDDVIEIRAVAYEFILLQACTYETFLSVDVELLVGFHHLGHLDGIEVPDFGFSRMHLSVLALEILKPVDGDIGHVGEVVFYFSQFCLDLQQEVIRLILIIF